MSKNSQPPSVPATLASAIGNPSADAVWATVPATTETQPQSAQSAVDGGAKANPATADTRGPVILGLAAVLGLALMLRTQHLSDLTMHFEECCAWKMSQFPWDEMLDAVSRDAHPPLYYILMHGVGKIGAESPVVLRGISVLFGLATILAAFWFVRTALVPGTLRVPFAAREVCTTSSVPATKRRRHKER